MGYRSHPYVGGQGIYLYYLSRELVELGHEVTIFSGQPYPDIPPKVKLQKVPGLNLYQYENPLRQLRFCNLFSWADIYEWLSKLSGGFAEPEAFGMRLLSKHLKQLKTFDIVHDNQSLCYALPQLLKRKYSVVATVHHPIHIDKHVALNSTTGSWNKLLAKRWYAFLGMQEKVLKRLPHIITVSQSSKLDTIKYFACPPDSITVIPNGIDSSTFKPLLGHASGLQRIITTASSDQPMKGLGILLRALASLDKTLPHLQLFVVGTINKNGETAKLLRDLKLENKVDFASGLSTQELVKTYNSSVLAICPSIYEGFGMPALEAMACGVPVISTDGGGLPEVVGDAGLIVPAGNAEALASAIEKLICDKYARSTLRQKALLRVKNHYTWKTIAKRYTQYYSQVLAEAFENANT